ncbi:MAG: hypothetical protein IPP19_15420 [Verrucomicrobia bacterium]|nr:hypothetical protein [Verrucomicrobiota bacterium]
MKTQTCSILLGGQIRAHTWLRYTLVALALVIAVHAQQPIIVDHTCTNIRAIPSAAITQAKSSLHIAYGHTSHGSQLTDGMSGLVTFMNRFPNDAFADNLFAFNGSGSNGALHLADYYGNFGGLGTANDLGAPDRTTGAATRTYLTAHPEINVIIWSWCGQVDGTQADIQQYLTLMSTLETDFPT